jgi:hypothetical protein
MYRETAYFATNYEEEIEKLGKPGEMSRMGKVVQFDYVLPVRLFLSRSFSTRFRMGRVVNKRWIAYMN